ncbi:hypothetical protein NUW58_g2912 [Xylaria curta]|uniref:Uncharacterized protein n=1 Tax=Xylaria curta TaxID=42375 RepID=A0ACC1PDE4_9PEZI|nr:hypothetical protein NUW58_g2912 [Xylaria curta]
MVYLLSPNFVLPDVSVNELVIASIAFGFTLGFGQLTAWNAAKQTWVAYRNTGLKVFWTVYFWMIWMEILVCLAFAIICILYLLKIIRPSFDFYFSILTLWSLQVQLLLQIIINRCQIIAYDRRFTQKLKIGVAVLITAVNISVYNIWIPARLQISETYIHTNEWWDRVEKVIYLLVDASLNIYFIRVVQKRLVSIGITKYRSLVHFNMFIIGFSLSMDVLIISMMSLRNTFVYMQFHPLAYLVKLNIELSMADLIMRVAKSRENAHDKSNLSRNGSAATSHLSRASTARTMKDSRNNPKSGDWDHGLGIRAGTGFNDLARPDVAYSVNATTNTDTESALFYPESIHTTREFRVEFEDIRSQSRSELTSFEATRMSRGGSEAMLPLESEKKGYISQDDWS